MLDNKYCYLLVLLFALESCVPLRSIFLIEPDKKDIDRFPFKEIKTNKDCFEFKISKQSFGKKIMLNDCSDGRPTYLPLEDFSPSHHLRSFIVIQNDSIKYEYYGQNTNKNSLHPSYSLAKSFISALIGVAIDEGYIKSVNDLAKNYLPNLSKEENYKNLTINHLLNHTSGIKSDLKIDAHLYYGRDLFKGIKKIRFIYKPGTKQEYLNVNSQILGLIIEKATKMSPSMFLQEKIWKPIKTCDDAIWSTDNKNKTEKTFCCIGATTRDYAKFGRLYLSKGQINENQIISSEWINKTLKYTTEQGSNKYYNNSWYLGLEKYGDYMAKGLYKQYIYLNKKKNLIIVALNNRENKLKAEKVKWIYLFRQISDQL